MTSATAAPSPFAALLRRSKFASYDPLIAQVYTTYGGHAHRGDWGVKRNLAIRQRNSNITLQAIDTRYQQTEWRSANKQASWMKRWPELSKDVNLDVTGSWYRTVSGQVSDWQVDTDFALKSGSSERSIVGEVNNSSKKSVNASDTPVPNIFAMPEGVFNRYVERIRKLRPEFCEFLQMKREEAAEKSRRDVVPWSGPPVSVEPVNPYKLAQGVDSNHYEFLATHSQSQASNQSATKLTHFPHPNGGLSYSHTPELQEFFNAEPLPGRVLAYTIRKAQRTSAEADVIVSGFVGKVSRKEVASNPALDLSYDDENQNRPSGEGSFRAARVVLTKAPVTVGRKHDELDGVKLKMLFRAWKTGDRLRSNPHQPGSRKYVAHTDRLLGEGNVIYGKKIPGYGEVDAVEKSDATLSEPAQQKLGEKHRSDTLVKLSRMLLHETPQKDRT